MEKPDFTSRVVIITGGAGAVGTTVSKRWLDAGASVLVVDHRQTTIDEWLTHFKANDWGNRLATLATDVATETGAAEMVKTAIRAFGQSPDTLLHLVGGFAAAAVEDDNAARTWNAMMTVNLTSAFQCYRAVLPSLRKRGGGWIVALSSRVVDNPGAGISAYAASKAGLGALTSSLSREVRGDGIHVNLIVASTIDTPANRESMGEEHASKWVTPDDIADATIYLCSDKAKSVYGATLEAFGKV